MLSTCMLASKLVEIVKRERLNSFKCCWGVIVNCQLLYVLASFNCLAYQAKWYQAPFYTSSCYWFTQSTLKNVDIKSNFLLKICSFFNIWILVENLFCGFSHLQIVWKMFARQSRVNGRENCQWPCQHRLTAGGKPRHKEKKIKR